MSGPPIVFIHGFPLSGGAWKHQMEHFRNRSPVHAPDLPGFGAAAAKSGPATMEAYADDLHVLLGQLGTGPVVLAGHSMGGYIALAFAKKYPGMLRGLALVSTRPGPDSPEVAAGRLATAGKVAASGTGVVVDAMAPKMVADQGLIPQVRSIMASASPAGVVAALRGMAGRPDMTGFLPNLHVPVWIVTGDADALIPAVESEQMAKLIPNPTLTVIPGAGHLVAYEKPSEFNAALGKWLESIT